MKLLLYVKQIKSAERGPTPLGPTREFKMHFCSFSLCKLQNSPGSICVSLPRVEVGNKYGGTECSGSHSSKVLTFRKIYIEM